jgi:hypothetical protein
VWRQLAVLASSLAFLQKGKRHSAFANNFFVAIFLPRFYLQSEMFSIKLPFIPPLHGFLATGSINIKILVTLFCNQEEMGIKFIQKKTRYVY